MTNEECSSIIINVAKATCDGGGIGIRARLRGVWETVRVQVPSTAPSGAAKAAPVFLYACPAERIAAEVASEVDIVTTAEAGIEILSRRAWLNRGGFGGRIAQGEKLKILHIFEPLAFARESDRDYSLLIERSEYNFWDYFALKIMKTGNKLLSLIKPKNIL